MYDQRPICDNCFARTTWAHSYAYDWGRVCEACYDELNAEGTAEEWYDEEGW